MKYMLPITCSYLGILGHLKGLIGQHARECAMVANHVLELQHSSREQRLFERPLRASWQFLVCFQIMGVPGEGQVSTPPPHPLLPPETLQICGKLF